MHSARPTLALAAVAVTALIAATALYAQDARRSSGSMMGGGMMSGGGMSQMMDHCAGMMSSHRHGDRPNEQWRRTAPGAADKDR